MARLDQISATAEDEICEAFIRQAARFKQPVASLVDALTAANAGSPYMLFRYSDNNCVWDEMPSLR